MINPRPNSTLYSNLIRTKFLLYYLSLSAKTVQKTTLTKIVHSFVAQANEPNLSYATFSDGTWRGWIKWMEDQYGAAANSFRGQSAPMRVFLGSYNSIRYKSRSMPIEEEILDAYMDRNTPSWLQSPITNQYTFTSSTASTVEVSAPSGETIKCSLADAGTSTLTLFTNGSAERNFSSGNLMTITYPSKDDNSTSREMDRASADHEEGELASNLDEEQKQDAAINRLSYQSDTGDLQSVADNQDDSSTTIDLTAENKSSVVAGPFDAIAERMKPLSPESVASVEALLLHSKLEGKTLTVDSVVTKYQSETLTLREIRCLRVDTELTSSVIDFYLTLLQIYLRQVENHLTNTPGVIIYRLDFIDLLTQGKKKAISVDRVEKGYHKVNIFIGVSKLLIPCNPEGHWTWIEVLMDEHVLVYHDSLRGLNNKDFEFYTNAILAYLRAAATIWGMPLERSWQRRKATTDPKQDNCTDCGVFTCMGIDFASASLSLAPVNSTSMPLFRLRIANAILERRVPYSIPAWEYVPMQLEAQMMNFSSNGGGSIDLVNGSMMVLLRYFLAMRRQQLIDGIFWFGIGGGAEALNVLLYFATILGDLDFRILALELFPDAAIYNNVAKVLKQNAGAVSFSKSLMYLMGLSLMSYEFDVDVYYGSWLFYSTAVINVEHYVAALLLALENGFRYFITPTRWLESLNEDGIRIADHIKIEPISGIKLAVSSCGLGMCLFTIGDNPQRSVIVDILLTSEYAVFQGKDDATLPTRSTVNSQLQSPVKMPTHAKTEGYPEVIRVLKAVTASDASRRGNAFISRRTDPSEPVPVVKSARVANTPLAVDTSTKPVPSILKGTVVESLSPVDVPIGLPNLAYTCYMNALLQCMNAWLYDYAHKDALHPIASDLLQGQHKEVLDLLRYLLLGDETDDYAKDLVRSMAAKYEMDLHFEHDPSELWAKISSTLDPKESLCSFIETQKYFCGKCRKLNSTQRVPYEYLDDVIFHEPPRRSVVDYPVSRPIELAVAPARKQVADFNCEQCEAKKVNATVESKKTGFKDFIVVSLMMARPGPNNTTVKASSKHLKLDGKITIEDRQYDLMAVTMHVGATLHAGHYFALVRIKNTWYKVDDKKVQVASADYVYARGTTPRRGDPTMLFYRISSSVKRKEEVYRFMVESPIKGVPLKKLKLTVETETEKKVVADTKGKKKSQGNKK